MPNGLQIGRVGIGTALTDPMQWVDQGDHATIQAVEFAASAAAAQVIRQQLSGYLLNEFEKIVPVIWQADPAKNGFYRVSSVQITTQAESFSGYLPFSVGLERIQGYASPAAESVLRGAARTNTPGGVTPQAWWWVPSAWVPLTNAFVNGELIPSLTVGARGTMNLIIPTTLGGASPLYSFASMLIPSLSHWYDGAATLTVDGNVIVGRQIPTIQTGWQLDNGSLKVVPSATAGSSIDVYVNNAGSWYGPTTLDFVLVGSPDSSPVTMPTPIVRRNAPEEVALGFYSQVNDPSVAGAEITVNMTLSLQRGSYQMQAVLQSPFSAPWGVKTHTPTACSVITSGAGIVATSYDGNGNKAVLISADPRGEDLTNGKLWSSPNSTQFVMGISLAQTLNSGSTFLTATGLRDQFCAVMGETCQVVAA